MIGLLSVIVTIILLRAKTKSPALLIGAGMFALGLVTGVQEIMAYGPSQERRIRAIEYNLPKGDSLPRNEAIAAIQLVALGDRNLHKLMAFPIAAFVISGGIFLFVALKRPQAGISSGSTEK